MPYSYSGLFFFFFALYQSFCMYQAMCSKLQTKPMTQTLDSQCPAATCYVLGENECLYADITWVPQTPQPRTELTESANTSYALSQLVALLFTQFPRQKPDFCPSFVNCPHKIKTSIISQIFLKYSPSNLSLVSTFHLFPICHLDPCRSSY